MNQTQNTNNDATNIDGMEVPRIDQSQAIAVSVTFRRFGATRQGDMNEVETSADKAMTKLIKRLFCSSDDKDAKCAEYDAITSFDGQTYAWLMSMSVPLLGRRNVRLVKRDAVGKIETYLKDRAKERSILVDAFLKVYPLVVEAAKKRLNGQFDPSNYPSVDQVGRKFTQDWHYLALGVPDNLPEEIKAEFAAKAEVQWKETAAEIRDGLRVGFVQLVDHLIQRLEAKGVDKKAKFHESTVDNVLEFIDSLNSRNLTNDKVLETVSAKAKELIQGAKVKELKTDGAARNQMIASMSQVRDQISSLLTPERKRKIDLD